MDSPANGLAAWRRWRRKVYVAMTSHNGQGVFARRQISPGEVVLAFTGKRLRLSEAQRDEDTYIHSLQIGPDACLSPSGGEDDYVNHSCDPNTMLQGSRRLVALRAIAPGEEITVDYSSFTDHEGFEMDCHCGAPACRRRILGYASVPESLRRQKHFQTWPAKLASKSRP